MVKIISFKEDTHYNNQIIQKALQEVDVELLALSLFNVVEEEKEIFYRNVSTQVKPILKDCISRLKDIPKDSILKAQESITEKLNKYKQLADKVINK